MDTKLSCIPLTTKIHDGNGEIVKWAANGEAVSAALVGQALQDGCAATEATGGALLLPDDCGTGKECGDSKAGGKKAGVPVRTTHVKQTIRDGGAAAVAMGRRALFLLDAYYLSAAALLELESAGNGQVDIVVRAASNTVAYRDPVRKADHRKRGNP